MISSSSLRSFLDARTASASCPARRSACHCDRHGRRLLHGHQQPLVSLGQAGGDGAVSRTLLGFGLLDLLRGEVELDAFGEDRIPGQVLACCFVKVLQARLVSGQEDQRVTMQAWRRAFLLQDLPCHALGSVALLLAYRGH